MRLITTACLLLGVPLGTFYPRLIPSGSWQLAVRSECRCRTIWWGCATDAAASGMVYCELNDPEEETLRLAQKRSHERRSPQRYTASTYFKLDGPSAARRATDRARARPDSTSLTTLCVRLNV